MTLCGCLMLEANPALFQGNGTRPTEMGLPQQWFCGTRLNPVSCIRWRDRDLLPATTYTTYYSEVFGCTPVVQSLN